MFVGPLTQEIPPLTIAGISGRGVTVLVHDTRGGGTASAVYTVWFSADDDSCSCGFFAQHHFCDHMSFAAKKPEVRRHIPHGNRWLNPIEHNKPPSREECRTRTVEID